MKRSSYDLLPIFFFGVIANARLPTVDFYTAYVFPQPPRVDLDELNSRVSDHVLSISS